MHYKVIDTRGVQPQVFFFTWATGSQLRNEGFTLGTFVFPPTPQQQGLGTVIWSTLYLGATQQIYEDDNNN